ncbi:MAG: hypothetical protein MJK07_15765 [Flavobacteriales bacterium]|nr:hypothetical protein [Flavobacteriales bacterium]
MNRLLTISILLVLGACSTNKGAQQKEEKTRTELTNIVSENYELIIPEKQDGFLILFPCFPCDAENTRTEFNIVDIASSNNITVLLMNFNQHLWLSETEKEDLEEIIVNAVKQNNINTDNTYIGGFSSGGNVSLLLADYLKSTESTIQPKGLFIADSPIDLLGLYENAQKNIEKNFSEPAVQEAKWIVEMFDPEFGTGEAGLINYENKSPYFSKTNSIKNLSNLSDVKIRLYSEPDTLWWRENRQAEYEDMNAYYIEQLANDLTKLYGESQVTFIRTENRGYRANGDRHPHSWAIIDEQDLIDWIKAN